MSDHTPIDCASDALFDALNATCDLIQFARHPRSVVPSATLAELLPPQMKQCFDPVANEWWAQDRPVLVARVHEEAGQLLSAFYAGYLSLFNSALFSPCILPDCTLLDWLTAAWPGAAVTWSGIPAASPAAWVVAFAFDVRDRITRSAKAGHPQLGTGSLLSAERDVLLERWADVHGALAAVHLPDRAAVAAELDRAVSIAGVAWQKEQARRRVYQQLKDLAEARAQSSSTEDDSAFRPAKEFIDQKHPDFSTIGRVLEAHPEIKTKRPQSAKTGKEISNRLLIRAGHWKKYLAQVERASLLSDKALDAAAELAESENREPAERTKRRWAERWAE